MRRNGATVGQQLSCVVEDHEPVAESAPALTPVADDGARRLAVACRGRGARWGMGAVVASRLSPVWQPVTGVGTAALARSFDVLSGCCVVHGSLALRPSTTGMAGSRDSAAREVRCVPSVPRFGHFVDLAATRVESSAEL